MTEKLPKFEVFSNNLVNNLLDYVLYRPHLQENGLPSYSDLAASNQTFSPVPGLFRTQQKDYETLRSNLAFLLKNYSKEQPANLTRLGKVKTPLTIPDATNFSKTQPEVYKKFLSDLEYALKNPSTESDELPANLSRCEQALYGKITEYLHHYVLNANLTSARKSKPNFLC